MKAVCLALLLVLLAATTPARAQGDTLGGGLHTTLSGWADDALLYILDRDAARGGRLSDRGILQRFWFDIDPDYQINLMRMRFDLIDDAEWYRHASGVRYWSGSVNTRDEAIGAECGCGYDAPRVRACTPPSRAPSRSISQARTWESRQDGNAVTAASKLRSPRSTRSTT